MTDPVPNAEPQADQDGKPDHTGFGWRSPSVWLDLMPRLGAGGRHRFDPGEAPSRRRAQDAANETASAAASIEAAIVVPPVLRTGALRPQAPSPAGTQITQPRPAQAEPSAEPGLEPGPSAEPPPADQADQGSSGDQRHWLAGQALIGLDRIAGSRPPGARRSKIIKPPRSPQAGLIAVLPLAFLAAFFAWTSAEPLWLALGHAQPGTATVIRCIDRGLAQRCQASFQNATGELIAARIPLIGAGRATAGAQVPARMVSERGRAAYADRQRGLRAGWTAGLTMVAVCGLLLAWAGGATRLPTRRSKLIGFALSLGGPAALLLGMLTVAW